MECPECIIKEGQETIMLWYVYGGRFAILIVIMEDKGNCFVDIHF